MPINAGGIVPEEPPIYKTGPFGARPRGQSYGPGVTLRGGPQQAPMGAGAEQLESLPSRFSSGPSTVSMDDISLAGMRTRARNRALMEAVHGGEEPFDPKLAQIEEGQKDLALTQLQEQQELAQPVTSPKPVLRHRDVMAEEVQDRQRQRLEARLAGIQAQQDEQLKILQQEVMASPEYMEADDTGKRQLLAGAQAQAQQFGLALERRITNAASLAAGKGLPTSAYPRDF